MKTCARCRRPARPSSNYCEECFTDLALRRQPVFKGREWFWFYAMCAAGTFFIWIIPILWWPLVMLGIAPSHPLEVAMDWFMAISAVSAVIGMMGMVLHILIVSWKEGW